jgi:hypothetical protein
MLQKGRVQPVTLGAKAPPELALATDRAIAENPTTMSTRSDFVRLAVIRYLRDLGFTIDGLTERSVNERTSEQTIDTKAEDCSAVKRTGTRP